MRRPKLKKPKIVEVDLQQLQEFLQHVQAMLSTKDYDFAKAVTDSLLYLTDVLSRKDLSIRRLQQLLFGAKTEKTDAILGRDTETTAASSSTTDSATETPESTAAATDSAGKRRGNGRNGADAYQGASTVQVPHPSSKPGDPCPECGDGTLYEVKTPGVWVRIIGQAPLRATVYQRQKLRCNLCGKVFTAPKPAEAGSRKYDATAASMIGLMKYGCGFPFNRMQRLQGSLGIPLAASTQWDIIHEQARRLDPAHVELERQAAQGDVVHNDDTAVKILEFMGKRAQSAPPVEDCAEEAAREKASKRTGLFTSGVVATTREGHRIALFFSGRQHAGENLADVLRQRAEDLDPPIQMCDALSRNLPAELKTILANCLAHARRRFADVAVNFHDECRHVLKALEVVYHNDALAREQHLSAEQRLLFHQARSGPVMNELETWLRRQIEERLVEPNSSLGDPITYLLKHWPEMTLFLRQPGAPLDNNLCERALKKAILHRKNAYFYKTRNGARVGDLYMSLIHTCELCGADPFNYLTELDRHAQEVADRPQDWMPWNYQSALTGNTAPRMATP